MYPGSPLQPPPKSSQEDFGIMINFLPYPIRQGKGRTRKEKSRGSPDSLHLDVIHFPSRSRFFSGSSGRACRRYRTPCAGFIVHSRTMCFVGRVELPKLNRVYHCNHFFTAHFFQQSCELRAAALSSVKRIQPATALELNCTMITVRKISVEISLQSGYFVPAVAGGLFRPSKAHKVKRQRPGLRQLQG